MMSRQEIRSAVLHGTFLKHVEESHEYHTLEIQKAHTYTSAQHSRFNTHSWQKRTQGLCPEFVKNKLVPISNFIRFICKLGVEV